MPDSATLALFLTATVALNLSPGPDVFFVLANSMAHGPRGGLLATLGVSGGIVVHTLLAAFGIASLLAAYPVAYEALRLVGAAYLIWLGISALRTSREPSSAPAALSTQQILARGFLTNLLNPKVALFFLAFLPQFVEPSRGAVAVQMLVLGTLFICSGTVVNAGYALLGGWVHDHFRREPRWHQRLQQVSGSILVALGARLLLPQRSE
jgi:threonine/homoserine/homoserine lactone efflux protein